jgi:hypothetical protein
MAGKAPAAKAALLTPSEGPQTAAAPPAAPVAQVPAVQASGAVALPADLAAEFAAEAQDAAAKERPAISRLSLKNGMISYMQTPMPGNAIEVVLLVGTVWHKFYEGRYDPNNIVNPSCFAIGADEDAVMAPHENVAEPRSDACASCPNFQWGSDPGGGRGKACKETRRLVLIPATALESPEAVAAAELALVDIPVTSVRNYGHFVNTLAATVHRPMYAVVTKLATVPDPKTQFKLTFMPTRTIDDPALIAALRARRADAARAASIPYDESYLQGEPAQAPDTSGRTAKFRGA